jgi:hypothetical protein
MVSALRFAADGGRRDHGVSIHKACLRHLHDLGASGRSEMATSMVL